MFRFEKDGQGYVLVSNEGTNGHVVADAVQFLPVDDDGARRRPTRRSRADPKRRRCRPKCSELEARAEAADASRARSGRRSCRSSKKPRRSATRRSTSAAASHNLGATVPRGFLTCVPVEHAAAGPAEPERPAAARRVARAPGQPAAAARDGEPRVALADGRRASCARSTTSARPASRRRTRNCSTTSRRGSSRTAGR